MTTPREVPDWRSDISRRTGIRPGTWRRLSESTRRYCIECNKNWNVHQCEDRWCPWHSERWRNHQ